MKLQAAVIKVIESDRPSITRFILYLLSLLYSAGLFCKNIVYAFGFKKPKRAPIPVICIGNIVAGGAGKTPFVEKLAQDLEGLIKVAIISKGYKSCGSSKKKVISPVDKQGNWVLPKFCGDEPFLLKKHLPHLDILISKDRLLAIKKAAERGADLALLDDGFQRLSLYKDINIIVLSAKNLFGKGCYLPRGYLRDSPSRLKEADLLCVTQLSSEPSEYQQICKRLSKYSQAKVIGGLYEPIRIKGALHLNLDELKGRKIGVFCGIGSPKQFLRQVEELGCEIVDVLTSQDHELPNKENFYNFSFKCQALGSSLLLCTEKDFVKIQDSSYNVLPVCYLESRFVILHGKNHYHDLISKIVNLKEER